MWDHVNSALRSAATTPNAAITPWYLRISPTLRQSCTRVSSTLPAIDLTATEPTVLKGQVEQGVVIEAPVIWAALVV